MARFLLLLAPLLLSAADLQISRPARPWEFLDATGPKASILGHEDGTLEAYIYPLKIFKDLRLRFRLDGRVIPAESVARRIISRPGSYTIVYSGDEYEVRETLAASADQPGAVIRLEINAHTPMRVDVEFTRDFQLMWPASIGTSYAEWSEKEKAWMFGADGQPFKAVLGSPDAVLLEREYGTNYSAQTADTFSLGRVNGRAERVLVLADSLPVYRKLAGNVAGVIAGSEKRARDYLARTVSLDLPDKQLEAAYDWSRLSQMNGMVENPLLGTGLVAGYGPSKGVYRPGFAWFFGRDTFWTTFALTSAGDLVSARAAIDFIAKYQREDGKIPHEISQSASLVPWFKDYPYGYASADATPLYVIAVRNYVQASGDADYARTHWPRLLKAFEFMRANFEINGFPKNFNNGHGWVEGGPLLPVQVELYQAGCYVEALRSMAMMARVTGDAALAAKMDAEAVAKRKVIEDRFWLPAVGAYAFALDTSDRPVDQPSVLATVPMWFGVLDADRSRAMIERLSEEDHAADWGMRIISNRSSQYGPEGYHYGSVWPLFTGWASVGEYRYHAAQAGYANLRANAWLALDGAGGHTTEVLSGLTYSPLSTASPHQIWSAAMVVSPLLRGLLGLDVDVIRKHVTFAPHLPADWNHVGIRGVAGLDFDVNRDETWLNLRVFNHKSTAIEVDFAPAYAPSAKILSPAFQEERTPVDWHPHFLVQAKPGETLLKVAHRGAFGYAVAYESPQLGAYSENLKVISERWTGGALQLTVSGLASRQYTLKLVGAGSPSMVVDMPAGEGYVRRTITIQPVP